MFCLLVVLAGWAVGAEFHLGNRLLVDADVSSAAAVTYASDHIGAAAGALLAGVVLIPVLGIAGACSVLAAFKVTGLLLLGSAVATRR